jgi:hypothetical protein
VCGQLLLHADHEPQSPQEWQHWITVVRSSGIRRQAIIATGNPLGRTDHMPHASFIPTAPAVIKAKPYHLALRPALTSAAGAADGPRCRPRGSSRGQLRAGMAGMVSDTTSRVGSGKTSRVGFGSLIMAWFRLLRRPG